MDPIALLYYGVVCASLALLGSNIRRPLARVATGFVVGLLAAALLPSLKELLLGV